MRVSAIAHKLQYAAPVIKYYHTDNNKALLYVVNVLTVLLLFADAFDKLTEYR